MVERNVNAMSVRASPVVKKIFSVAKIALGCDQKNLSMKPVSAPISQNATMPSRMPNWTPRITQAGQSLCTGSRRTGFAGGPVWAAALRGGPGTAREPATHASAAIRSAAMSGSVMA